MAIKSLVSTSPASSSCRVVVPCNCVPLRRTYVYASTKRAMAKPSGMEGTIELAAGYCSPCDACRRHKGLEPL